MKACKVALLTTVLSCTVVSAPLLSTPTPLAGGGTDLMPGTEYQFRLRAFSNGSWQACEEAIVSSPFRTVCAPPDPPPTFPTFCQLESDPLVAGGLLDTGALLARRPDETLGRSRGNISSTDKLKDESVAEKEKPLSNKKKSPGRNRAASLTRDMEATGIVVAGETQQGRRGLEGNVKTRSRDWDHKESGLQLLSARDQGGKGREGSAVGHQGEGTEEASSSRAGSTSIVLQWEAGCPNGAIVMNYEVCDGETPIESHTPIKMAMLSSM